MPMPKLDPLQFVPVMPVDPTHKVPRKDGLRTFSQDPANPDTADLFDPYDAQLLAGGSLRRACDVETADAQAAVAKAAADRETEAKAAAEKSAADEKAEAVRKPVASPADPAKTDGTKTDGTKADTAKSTA